MDIQIEKESFVKALSFCQNVAEKRSTMPVLSHGLMSSDNGRLSITTTDLEVHVQASISCQVKANGQCCVPIRSLTSIVKDLGAEEVQLKLNENRSLELSSGTAVFRLNTLPPEDFPLFDLQSGKKRLNVSSQKLSQALDHTLFSMSSDETQMILNSVVFDLSMKNKWSVVSTDRHRLSYFEMRDMDETFASLGDLSTKKYVIPKKGAIEIKNMCELAGKDSIVGFYETNNALCFQHEDKLLFIRLIEGDYPNYSHFINAGENCSEFVLNRQKLVSALKRTSVLSSEKLRSVQLTFRKDHLHLYSTSETLGDAQEVVKPESVKAFNEDEVVIMLNSRYLTEPLSVMTSDQVRLMVRDNESHVVLLPGEDDNYRSLIMPLRI